MDIQFTEEQELLRSSVQRLLRDQYDFDARRKIVASEDGWSRKQWEAFAELGLFAAPFSEDVGGLGGGPLSTMIIMQEFGRHLVVEPFVETVVLAGGLLEHAGSSDQKQDFIPDIIAGSKIWTLAWTEKGSRFDLANVATTARREGKDYVLTGEKTAVITAPWADRLIGDELSGITDLRLGAGRKPRDAGFACAEAEIEVLHQRERLLMGDEHVDHPVLQHLEGADRGAELLSGLGIFQRRGVQFAHGADGFGA